MTYRDLVAGMEQYGSTEKDICVHALGVSPEQIQQDVVLAPWWEPDTLPALGKATYLSSSEYSAVKVWQIDNGGCTFTYIKTGIGAPVLMDALLGLGVTGCKNVVFVGSVGALSHDIGIGDIVIPEYSICGDGASRYIRNAVLAERDIFGEKSYPDPALLEKAIRVTDAICKESNVRWHRGSNFSVDTIFAQFAHLDEIIGMGCNVIEMETAAAFEAAAMMGIALVAVFSVSDNTVAKKSLVSGRTDKERTYRKFVRREVFPQIILDILDLSFPSTGEDR